MLEINHKYCSLPFTSLQVALRGENQNYYLSGYPCCRDWIKGHNDLCWAVPLNKNRMFDKDYLADQMHSLFNIKQYAQLRATVADGSYAMCNDSCPYKASFDRKPVSVRTSGNWFYSQYTDLIQTGCNYRCVHCVLWACKKPSTEANLISNIMTNIALENCTVYCTPTTGEPFTMGSIHRLFTTFKHSTFPNLKTIRAISNGSVLTEAEVASWSPDILNRVIDTHFRISLDAAQADTYMKVKHRDIFNDVVGNISNLVKVFTADHVQISFIVSKDSYQDIKILPQLMNSLGVKTVHFYLLDNRINNPEKINGLNVLSEFHPDYHKVVDIIHNFLHVARTTDIQCYLPKIRGVNA